VICTPLITAITCKVLPADVLRAWLAVAAGLPDLAA
jgi:hypothetical protein